jgi:hypothetical protein
MDPEGGGGCFLEKRGQIKTRQIYLPDCRRISAMQIAPSTQQRSVQLPSVSGLIKIIAITDVCA